MPADLAKFTQQNASRWAAMKVRPERMAEADAQARRLLNTSAKLRYQAVEKRTGVPWPVVAAIHLREASGSWSANIAQGDPWNAVSRHVPTGRGPFKSWEDAAYDALVNCPPYAARNKDWSIGPALTTLLRYNGLGYGDKPSPYLWAGTDQYQKGKFVADHVYDPEAVDRQLGCALVLKRMGDLDPTSRFWEGSGKPSTGKVASAGVAAGGVVIAGAGATVAAQHGHFDFAILGAFALVVAGVLLVRAVRRW